MTKIKTLLLTLVAMLASTSMFAQTAKIGETEYASLAEAVAAVTTSEPTTITMIADENIEISTPTSEAAYAVTVAANKNVVLELNGHKVIGQCTYEGTSALIRNLGTLTIQDCTDTDKDGSGDGALVGGASPTWTWDGSDNYVGSYASNLIRNEGTLTIESGYFTNVSTGSAAYAVDNYGSGKVTVNGGKLLVAKSSVIRMFYNNGGALTINDGIIGDGNNYMGVQVQNTGTNGVNVTLAGGEFYGQYAVYAGEGSAWATSSLTITGGTYKSFVGFTGSFTNISVTGGTFEDYCYSWNQDHLQFITGGIYKYTDPSNFVVDGYIAAYDEDNDYWVVGKLKETGFTPTGTEGEYKATQQVVDDDSNVLIAKEITVTVEGSEVGANSIAETALAQVDVAKIVETVVESAEFEEGDNVNVTIVVVSTPVEAEVLTYDVNPEAIVTVNNNQVGTLKLENDDLAENATFTFNLDVTGLGVTAGDKVKVTHKSDDAAYEDETSVLTVKGTSGNYYVTVETSHFSTFELTLANSVTLNGEFATYCPAVDVDFTGSELEAYVAISGTSQTGYVENIVYLERVYTVAEGEGVLLRGNTGNYTVSLATGAVESVENNLFKGVLVDTKIDPTVTGYTNFYLTNQVGGASAPLAFYLVPSDGKVIPAGKAYLQLANEDANTVPEYGATSAKGLTFVFGDATGIKTVDNATIGNAVIYDLQGRRVQNPTRGIYVVNGKKVVIK